MKIFFSFFAASLVVSSAQDLSLYETVTTTADLSTLATAIGLAGLEEYFTTTADLTVFAPSNAALESLPPKFLTPGFALHLKNILEFHVIQGDVVPASDITDGMVLDMLTGESIAATVNDMGVFLSGLTFTDSQVTTPDVFASNGVAHIVDQYFFPQSLTLSLYDLTGQVTGFESVLDLILQSGLEEELRADNRTVLAPSDGAFAALPEEFLDEVTENAELRDSIVLYHVIIGSYPLEIIEDGLEVMTASGNPLSFEVIGGGRFAQYSAVGPTNSVPFGVANLVASNGMAHTIDGVLEAPPLAAAPTSPVPDIPVEIPVEAPVAVPVATMAPIRAPTMTPIMAPVPAPTLAPVIPPTTEIDMQTREPTDLSLYATVALTADLSILATAINLLGLEEYFSTTTDLTLFTPTNAAFETLPQKFLTPGFLPHLKSLLEYHVVQGTLVPASDIPDGTVINMLNGDSITATVSEMGTFLGGSAFSNSHIIISDLFRTNGIGHVVNQYFLPQALTLSLYDLTGQVTGFESVLDLILQSGLEEELRADNRTVLAPSDGAFAALPAEFLAEVTANAELRDSIVLYHVIIGSYPLEIIVDGLEVMTASGNPLSFGVVGGGRFAQYEAVGPTNRVAFGVANLIASNGVAHTIDGVLEAPPLAGPPSVSPSTTQTEAPIAAAVTMTPTSSPTSNAPTAQTISIPTSDGFIGPPPPFTFAPTSSAWICSSAMAVILSAVIASVFP